MTKNIKTPLSYAGGKSRFLKQLDENTPNLENVNKISEVDVDTLIYASENMSENDLAETFHKVLIKNATEQVSEMENDSKDRKMLPLLPVICFSKK